MSWKLAYTRHAQKDAEKLAAAGLKPNAKLLLDILAENPFQNPPPYEKLVGDLAGAYSRTLGAIFLGVLSSGVWELIKPLLGPSWSGILTVATFGLDSLRDTIYADAAHVFESPLGLGVAVKTMAGVVLITGVAIISYIRATLQPVVPLSARLTYLLLFFGAITMFITASRATYVNRLARHYTQLETMAAPYIADLELKKLRSEFVQVNNRRLYLQQIEKLQKVISDNGGYPPYQYFF